MIQIDSGALLHTGNGSPEGVVTANVGDLFQRLDGGLGTTLYYKATGAGNTGWIAVAPTPAPTGNNYAFTTFDATGQMTSDASLLANKTDAFGRPQIWDFRTGGAGAFFRQGSWISDGDPSNVEGDGAAFIGKSINGVLIQGEGAYARIKKDRFGLFQIIPGFPSGFYMFRADCDATTAGGGVTMRDDTNTITHRQERKTGFTFNKKQRTGTNSSTGLSDGDTCVDGKTYMGDPSTDGSWRFYVSGSNLVFERRESAVWVQKGAFTP